MRAFSKFSSGFSFRRSPFITQCVLPVKWRLPSNGLFFTIYSPSSFHSPSSLSPASGLEKVDRQAATEKDVSHPETNISWKSVDPTLGEARRSLRLPGSSECSQLGVWECAPDPSPLVPGPRGKMFGSAEQAPRRIRSAASVGFLGPKPPVNDTV